MALGRKASAEPLSSEDMALLVGGRGAGGDGARERPALPAAAHQGRRARADAGVQREHPRVAERRPRGRSTATTASSAGTGRLEELYGVRHEDAVGRAPRRAVRRAGSSRCSARRAASRRKARRYYRVPLTTRHEPARRLLVNVGDHAAARLARRRSPARSSSSKTSRPACSSRSSCRSPRRWRRSACWPPASRTR